MEVILDYLKRYLLAEPEELFHFKNGVLLGVPFVLLVGKELFSSVRPDVKDRVNNKVNSGGESVRHLWRRIVTKVFPAIVGNEPEKRWGLLFYGLPCIIAYIRFRDLVAEPTAEHAATLAFFVLNMFYYVYLPPKRNRFTPTISSLYVDQGWTISFQYAACAGYMYMKRQNIRYLQYLAAVAGIFVFRTARTNLNTKDTTSRLVFYGETKSSEKSTSSGWAESVKLPKACKEFGKAKRRGVDEKGELLVPRDAEPDEMYIIQEKLGFKQDKDFYLFQTVPPYPQPDDPTLGRFHMFFVVVLMSLTLLDLWQDNTDDRLIRGSLSMFGYGLFGSASAMMFEDLEAREKTFWTQKNWKELITRRRYVELLCCWSFTCELILLCQTLA